MLGHPVMAKVVYQYTNAGYGEELENRPIKRWTIVQALHSNQKNGIFLHINCPLRNKLGERFRDGNYRNSHLGQQDKNHPS